MGQWQFGTIREKAADHAQGFMWTFIFFAFSEVVVQGCSGWVVW